MYRYCPTGDRWLETSEYTVGEHGQKICPEHEIAVHAGIDQYIDTEAQFRRQHSWMQDVEDEVRAAKRQGLIE